MRTFFETSGIHLLAAEARGAVRHHEMITDEHARYFGAEIDDESLVAGPHARLGAKHFEDWLRESAK